MICGEHHVRAAQGGGPEERRKGRAPTHGRRTCGTTSPTNPIVPVTAVAAPTTEAVPRINVSRSRGSPIPMAAAARPRPSVRASRPRPNVASMSQPDPHEGQGDRDVVSSNGPRASPSSRRRSRWPRRGSATGSARGTSAPQANAEIAMPARIKRERRAARPGERDDDEQRPEHRPAERHRGQSQRHAWPPAPSGSRRPPRAPRSRTRRSDPAPPAGCADSPASPLRRGRGSRRPSRPRIARGNRISRITSVNGPTVLGEQRAQALSRPDLAPGRA